MLNRKQVEEIKEKIRKRIEANEIPQISDFYFSKYDYLDSTTAEVGETILSLIASAEILAAHEEGDRLSDRLLPFSFKWPRFTDGKKVRFGDWIQQGNESFQLEDLTFSKDGSIGINNDFECGYEMCIRRDEYLVRGEAPKPPEPPCRDMNGEVIHEGDTVYYLNGAPLTVKEIYKTDWLTEGSCLLGFDDTPVRIYSCVVAKKRLDCVDQIIEEIESGKLTAASCIKTRLEAIKERKGADFGY